MKKKQELTSVATNRKPLNACAKRALEHREAKAVENPKTCLLLRGTSCSQVVQDALGDLYALRQPLAKKFTKKNAIRPFEDAASLEFFSDKNDASLLVFGCSQKKRPHALTLIRMFGHKVLEMVELLLDPVSYRRIEQFKTTKCAIGLRPMVLFAGAAFESLVANEYTLVKSIMLDLFKGEPSDKIDVEGLQYIVSVTAPESHADAKPPVHLRVYTIRTKRSGQKLPRVEVDEMGPRMDFRLGRIREPDEATLKEAMRRPRGAEERTKKNVSTGSMGDKMGRVHLGRQDLGQFQTRKMKGLKRSRRDDGDDSDHGQEDDAKRTKH